jgi:hypothetical protein
MARNHCASPVKRLGRAVAKFGYSAVAFLDLTATADLAGLFRAEHAIAGCEGFAEAAFRFARVHGTASAIAKPASDE